MGVVADNKAEYRSLCFGLDTTRGWSQDLVILLYLLTNAPIDKLTLKVGTVVVTQYHSGLILW